MDNASPSSNRQKIILAAFLALAMGAAGFLVFLMPARSALAVKKQQVAAVAPTTAPTAAVLADAETLKNAHIAIPAKIDIEQVKRNFRTRARGVNIVSITVDDSAPAKLSQGIQFKVVARGASSSLIPFVSKLDDAVYLVRAEVPEKGQIRLDPDEPAGPMMLVPQLQIQRVGAESNLYEARLTILVPKRKTA